MKPSVDVIVPCYNYADYLPACVESILSQPGVDVRVIVIDDCSSDDSVAVATRLAAADSRVTVRRHPNNHGHIATYNEGMAWVEASYFLLISADDLLTPGALGRAVEVTERSPDVAMVCGRQISFSSKPELPADFDRSGIAITPGDEFIRRVCDSGENPVATPTVVVRTSIQRLVGDYEPALPHTADLEMWLRCASFGDVAELQASQAFKRGHDRNMQHAYVRRGTGDIVERHDAFVRFLGHAECPVQQRSALRHSADRSVGMSAFWRGSLLFDQGAADDAELLFKLATDIYPNLTGHPEWRRMTLKRRLGARTWRNVSWALAGVSRMRRHLGLAGDGPLLPSAR